VQVSQPNAIAASEVNDFQVLRRIAQGLLVWGIAKGVLKEEVL
jgi:hypothetical protein